ncbi:MAG: hypothetical protein H6561_20215 [Lewinellaceae bacterium]|nr:hypothetical protein [Lewinellaceae bacterium]HQU53015.1 hypothetical protein [Saprospiraceae bacterium]
MIAMRPHSHIFLADRRKTMNYSYVTDHQGLVIRDYYLNPGIVIAGHSRRDEVTIVLPYVGDVVFDGEGGNVLIDEKQALVWHDLKKPFRLSNPYAEDAINFLHLTMPTRKTDYESIIVSLDEHPDKSWIELHPSVLLGRFQGRDEVTLQNGDQEHNYFVYSIQGAFEVNHCLLGTRDGLYLQKTGKLEIEALSPDAELLLIRL